MSRYNSTNTHVLATHEQKDGNTRMLLFHVCDSGRHEYVIGSYFQQEQHVEELGRTGIEVVYEGVIDYSWDWGHYFSSVVDAVDYWNREVAADLLEGFEVHGRQ